jgi:tetratricopeptide (TPR) repeat protein
MQKIDLSDVSDLEMKQEEMDEIEIDELFQKATDYFNSGNVQSAKEAYFMFKNIVERNPKYHTVDGWNPYYYLAQFHAYFINDADTAIKFYNKSLKFFPDDEEVLTNRGFCRLSKNQYDLAIKDFKKAKEYNSKYCDFDKIIQEAKNRLNGGRPIREYSRYFK